MAKTRPDPVDDAQEIEVSGYDPSGERRWSRPLPGLGTSPKYTRRARGGIAALIVLVSLLLIGLGIPDLRAALAARIAEAFGTPRAIPSVIARATPPPVAPAIPLVPAPSLALAPARCPAGMPLATAQVPFYGAALGMSPIFVIGLNGPHPTLRLGGATGRTYTTYGWPALLTWALAPGYTGTATLRVLNLADGTPIPISSGFSYAPAGSVVLNPNDINAPRQSDHWTLWFGMVYPPAAGCYALQASWPGGAWTLNFAAGR